MDKSIQQQKTISVMIPKYMKLNYTLFAEGNRLCMNREGPFIKIDFDFSSPVCLWYTYKFHRRLFIIMQPTLYELESVDVIGTFSILTQIQGRSYDRFKRSLRYICRMTQKQCYKFPPMFYFSLSTLAVEKKNSRENLRLLAHKYYRK